MPQSVPLSPSPTPLSWENYKKLVASLTPSERRFKARRSDGTHIPLFRGHREADWSLTSTLERHLGKEVALKTYLQSCHSAWSTLKSYGFADMPFDLASDTRFHATRDRLPHVEFMAFLRHHGFPSPLLDWTESPYIAAFFALEEPSPADRHPCVLIYRPDTASAKPAEPHILLLGPFLGTAQRHATQQCWYTAAIRKGAKGETMLCSQLEAFARLVHGAASPAPPLQKVVLQRADREKALAELAHMNITSFSLYGGIDSLIKTITPRVF